jgi:hypothetical protein
MRERRRLLPCYVPRYKPKPRTPLVRSHARPRRPSVPRVTIGMIVLNEEEYIERNLRQHYPLADRIVIVEGADRLYPKERVSDSGLSTDATAEIIRSFPDPDKKITFLQHGWTERGGAQAKCELRNRYLEGLKDGFLAVIDADEFYRTDDFLAILRLCKAQLTASAWTWPFIHFWKGTRHFITGGYYDVPHTRFWRVRPGMRYISNHNWPELRGRFLIDMGYKRHDLRTRPVKGGAAPIGPVGYHFGFAKSLVNERDKTDYYRNRGETSTRPETVASREAWFLEEGAALPAGLTLHRFTGTLPEVFT